MLTGVVCYIERGPGGNSLRRVRLVGPELDQSWVAPSVGADDPAKPGTPGEQLNHIRAAAAWIAEELAPVRELAAVCLDAEGGVCAWVSAPSTDTSVVMAAIRQSHAGAAGGAPAEPSSGSGGFGLLPDDALGLASARSVQALAEPETNGTTSVLARAGKQAALSPRRRMGVLSIADAPVRVLLDELDSLRIGVGAVLSFWHAACLAWDPSVERPSRRGSRDRQPDAGSNGLEPIVVEPDAPVTATLVIDPNGRLSWGWSRGGELIAAGSIRLRTHTLTRTPPAPPAGPAPFGEEPTDALSARRIPPAIEEPVESVHATECSSGDVGRLVMDWLSWSVQVGRTPDRIVCIGPATISQRPAQGADAMPTPGTLAQALGAAWPSASIDAAIHDDPIGATLNRLRVLPMFQPAKVEAPDAITPQDPRRSLVDLTTRPGRLDRSMHIWATLAILGAAAAVFIYANRVGSSIASIRARADAVQEQKTDLLKSVEDVIPALSKSPDPVGMLSGKIGEYAEQFKKLNASPPLLPKVLPALEFLQGPEFENVQITNVTVSEVQIRITFTVPETDDLTPAALRTKLDERFGAGVWGGNWGVSSRGRRPYDVYWVNPGGSAR